jgi:predicted HTH domain antitoxin
VDGLSVCATVQPMPVTLEFPQDIEEALRREYPNLDLEAWEACAVELFRQGRLNHFQLSRVLGVDRFEADAILKRHRVEEQSLSATELESDRETLRKVLGEAAR